MSTYQLNKDKFLSVKEIEALHVRLKVMPERDALMIQLFLNTGARAQELLNVKKSDLNYDEESVLIKGLKNSRDREIPLPKWLFYALDHYAKSVKGDFIFDLSYRRLAQIWDSCKPCEKGIHSLRHTFALELYKKCENIKTVQSALGHKSINNTMIYVDYVTSTRELRKVLLGETA